MPKVNEKSKHLTTHNIAEMLGIIPLKPSQIIETSMKCAATNTPVLILGRPGVGKTEIITEIAKTLQKNLIVERLNGRDPTDMGLPYVYKDDLGVTRHGWSLPDFVAVKGAEIPKEYPGGWQIFFDELAQALPAMQNRIGEMLNERQLNRAQLHDEIWFTLAANFAQDKAATYPIPRHILNRVAVFILAPDMDDFHRYCSTHNVRPEILAVTKMFPEWLDSYDPDSMVNCTPRSLVSVSRLMDTNPSYDTELALYASRIGKGIAAQFTGFLRVYRSIPTLEEIVKSPKRARVPDEDKTDVLCALSAMLGHALSPKNVAPVVEYLTRLPAEFCVFALRDAVYRDPELKKTRALTEWALEHGDILFQP